MSLVYTRAKYLLATGALNLATDDIRVLLVDSTTTADTQEDVTNLAAFTTLGELSGTGYARKTFTSEAVNEDTTNNRAEFDAEDLTWTAIDAGTAAAAIVYKHVGADSANIPIAYIDSGGFPKVTNGGDLTITWNAEGILQLT